MKAGIISAFWGLAPDDIEKSNATASLETYFEYYLEQANIALHERGRHVSVASHNDVIEIVQALKDDVPKDQIIRHLAAGSNDAGTDHDSESCANAVDLAVRLLTMMEIGNVPNSYISWRPLEWRGGSLRTFLCAEFPVSGRLTREHVKLERLFQAYNLERIAGIKIRWTNNLADHLRMLGDDDEEVAIFGCASYLDVVRARQAQSFHNTAVFFFWLILSSAISFLLISLTRLSVYSSFFFLKWNLKFRIGSANECDRDGLIL
ncbi:MAG: hypothetical protein LQ350_007820 [Teloschistes chrysophthalmus]|nr:MAG: hypothetical protein LQ350_007820 [Niorma chrysophthalma]